MKLGMEVGLDPGDLVLDGDKPPPTKRGHNPRFSAHVCCGQTAGWMKMPFGTEVGLGAPHCVRWGLLPHNRQSHATKKYYKLVAFLKPIVLQMVL